ncbi:MAG: molybdenum cofactor guanylyltransferase [Gemmatimonadales bacterium]|nr:molybdenum cofactor guanylyltransferase [Gemmatimonadales bacterium]MYK03030.1 molybdenum cofactor guanylyltransferase [Candidatus Palauibacter ramosifaciens]
MSGPERSLVVVAGGRSRRLGRDKPLVEIGGRTVLSRILEATEQISDVVLAVREVPPFRRALAAEGWDSDADRARPPGSVAFRSAKGRALVAVPDPVPDLGPLAGVASGLNTARGAICIVLAGDLPFVTPDLVDCLSRELEGDADLDAVVPHARGRAQPLCAAYRREVGRRAARLVARSAASGDPSPSMMSFLDRLRLRPVRAGDFPPGVDLQAATRGVDVPDDLVWAERRAADG